MNRLKFILFSLFISVILLASGYHNCVFADTSDVGVYIDGTAVDFPDVKPYISNDRTFVPVRFVSEQLGASVDWNNDTGTVVVNKGADSIKLAIGSTEVIKNGVSCPMDAAPVITDGRTMVPLRFVSEQLGAVVNWDASSNSVSIVTPNTSKLYIIQSGDTLWDIANTYGTTIEELLKVNPGLNPDKLMVGKQLYLPLSSSEEETPEISRGEGRAISLSCTADELVEYAKEYLGVPYAYGGTTPDGFDCSGFTQFVVANFGGRLPHSSSEQYNYGISIEREDLQLGDLVFFISDNSMKIGHVGIYIGDGKFIHAPQSGGYVEISNLSNVYFDKYYYGAIRIDTENGK
jgi:cell wall-associated NlpC family hydrolase